MSPRRRGPAGADGAPVERRRESGAAALPGGRLWFHIDPASGVPLHVQLRDQVRSAVASGVLLPGDRLPSVRELALHLTINPNTVFKVYQELEHQGLLETVHGKGVFVRADTTGLRFSDEERHRRIDAAVDHLVAQALSLGFSADELMQTVEQRLRQWWVGAGGGGAREEAGEP